MNLYYREVVKTASSLYIIQSTHLSFSEYSTESKQTKQEKQVSKDNWEFICIYILMTIVTEMQIVK